jgi:hypothetical protein
MSYKYPDFNSYFNGQLYLPNEVWIIIKDYCRAEIKKRASILNVRKYSTDLEYQLGKPLDQFIHHDLYNYYDFENYPDVATLYTVTIRPGFGDYKKVYFYNDETDLDYLYVESHDYPEPLGILRHFYNDKHILYFTEYVHPKKRVQQCTHNLKIKHWEILKNP